jgi:HAD superfamily hydrolase (TIGR01490 family)
MSTAQRLTLFDLDHTLLNGDSDYGWGQFAVRHGLVDPVSYERRNAEFYVAYRAGTLDQHAYLEFCLEPLTRRSVDELDEWHRRYMSETIAPMMTCAGRALVVERLSAGDLVAIVTSTNTFITGPIARAYGIEHLIASEAAREAGRYTGKLAGIPAFREGKITRVEDWLSSRGQRLADFSETWFFSDSINDLPLLKRVSHPVAVDPDPSLEQIARQCHWPVISLRDPADGCS